MSEIASRGQLRMSFLRVALLIVPFVLLLGSASGVLGGSNDGGQWYAALAKPSYQPPGWLFPIAWTILYLLIGLALSMVVWARGASGRGLAIGLFAVQFAINLAWSPLFFAMHRIEAAFTLILAMIVAAVAATLAMARVRRRAGLLMLPYLGWLCFAALLNHEIALLNPAGPALAPTPGGTQITL